MKKVVFESAAFAQREYLIELCMRSNAFYGYRSVSDEEARRVFLLHERNFKEGIVRVIKEAEIVIGFFGLINEKDTNSLSHLFLEPEFIGKGYGKLLFIAAAQAAKEELKWKSFQWESDPHSAVFYRKMGAKQIGENRCPLNPDYLSPVFIYDLTGDLPFKS